MRGDEIWAVVPAKDLAGAKSRLGGVLRPEERRGLVSAMLEDVLAALAAVDALAGIAVVTREPTFAECARAVGARVIADLRQAGPNAAIALAATRLAADGAEALIAIPADIPLVTPVAIREIVAAIADPASVTLVPALADMGTNALALTPVDAIAPCFGPQSFFRHQQAALARGIAPRILHLPEIGFDLDRPEDLAKFLAQPSETRSYASLREHGIDSRLEASGARTLRRTES